MKVINGHVNVLVDDDGVVRTARELVEGLVEAGKHIAKTEAELRASLQALHKMATVAAQAKGHVAELATKEHRITELQEQLGGTKLSLIRTTDSRGNRVLITSTAVATVTEGNEAQQYHGIRSIIRLLDGRVIESRDGCRTIEEQMIGEPHE